MWLSSTAVPSIARIGGITLSFTAGSARHEATTRASVASSSSGSASTTRSMSVSVEQVLEILAGQLLELELAGIRRSRCRSTVVARVLDHRQVMAGLERQACARRRRRACRGPSRALAPVATRCARSPALRAQQERGGQRGQVEGGGAVERDRLAGQRAHQHEPAATDSVTQWKIAGTSSVVRCQMRGGPRRRAPRTSRLRSRAAASQPRAGPSALDDHHYADREQDRQDSAANSNRRLSESLRPPSRRLARRALVLGTAAACL